MIGTADIGCAAVILAMQRARNAWVVAVAGRDLNRARSSAEKLDMPRAYGSYELILGAPDIDAV